MKHVGFEFTCGLHMGICTKVELSKKPLILGKIPKVPLGNETHVKTVDLRLSLSSLLLDSVIIFRQEAAGKQRITCGPFKYNGISTPITRWSPYGPSSLFPSSLVLSFSPYLFHIFPTTNLHQRVPLSLQLSGRHTLILLHRSSRSSSHTL